MCITQVQTKHFIVSDIKQTKNPKTFDWFICKQNGLSTKNTDVA